MIRGVGGDFSDLFPDGIQEAAYDHVTAVNLALQVLSWFENLPKDEQPPRHIWWSEKLLDQWFADVREQRSAGPGQKAKSSYQSAQDVPMEQNELVANLRPR